MKPAKSLEFDPAGFEDLAWWVETDRKKAVRLLKLIKEVRACRFLERDRQARTFETRFGRLLGAPD